MLNHLYLFDACFFMIYLGCFAKVYDPEIIAQNTRLSKFIRLIPFSSIATVLVYAGIIRYQNSQLTASGQVIAGDIERMLLNCVVILLLFALIPGWPKIKKAIFYGTTAIIVLLLALYGALKFT